jgi:hypothetical protein
LLRQSDGIGVTEKLFWCNRVTALVLRKTPLYFWLARNMNKTVEIIKTLTEEENNDLFFLGFLSRRPPLPSLLPLV